MQGTPPASHPWLEARPSARISISLTPYGAVERSQMPVTPSRVKRARPIAFSIQRPGNPIDRPTRAVGSTPGFSCRRRHPSPASPVQATPCDVGTRVRSPAVRPRDGGRTTSPSQPQPLAPWATGRWAGVRGPGPGEAIRSRSATNALRLCAFAFPSGLPQSRQVRRREVRSREVRSREGTQRRKGAEGPRVDRSGVRRSRPLPSSGRACCPWRG